MSSSLTRKRGTLIVAVALLLVAAGLCESLMRRSAPGVADPDTQQLTVGEVAGTISQRITAMGTAVTPGAIRIALQDQLPLLGAHGFVRVRIVGLGIDVLAGTDYGITGQERSASAGTWQDRLTLAPIGTQAEGRPMYILYLNSGLGDVWGELIIGSAGPTTAEAQTSVGWMAAMWSCVGLAALVVLFAFLPPATKRRSGLQHAPGWYGCIWMLVGLLAMAPVVWVIASRTLTDARTAFARSRDALVTAILRASRPQDTDQQWTTNMAYAFHQSLSMSSPGGFIRLLSDGTEPLLLGTDYGSAAELGSDGEPRWMNLAPVAGGTPRRLYVTSDSTGTSTLEQGTVEPDYWQMRRLRLILMLAISLMLIVLFAIGCWTHRRRGEPHTQRTPEETLRDAVWRQALLTMLVVGFTLVPAAGLVAIIYHEASVGRLDQQLQVDATALRGQLRNITLADLPARSPSLLEGLPVMQNGAVLRIRSGNTNFDVGWYDFDPPMGGVIPTTRMVNNYWDYSLAPGQRLPLRVIGASDKLKDGALYSFTLASTFRQVTQDMHELWTAAAWASPLLLLFIALAGAVSARLALRPVAQSMRLLDQFTGDAGHELRTPLASIHLNAQVALDQDQQPDEFRRHLTAIASQADRSTRLAESLLLLARLERQEDLQLTPVPLTCIWDELHAAFADQLTARNVTLRTPSDAMSVAANHDLLMAALDNLVENACRYSPEGGTIAVTARRADACVTIAVADQGPGMPPEVLSHVWDRFYRVDDSRSRDSGGNGLGLAIVRKAVEAMGGRVAVTSEVGKGTTFSLTFPAR